MGEMDVSYRARRLGSGSLSTVCDRGFRRANLLWLARQTGVSCGYQALPN
jgi:hypothetical protein